MLKKFTKEKVAEEENEPAVYYFYDKNKNNIYVGHTKVAKHRLQSYYQKDDFQEHRTKKPLRNKIEYYALLYFPDKHSAKEYERSKKYERTPKYNVK